MAPNLHIFYLFVFNIYFLYLLFIIVYKIAIYVWFIFVIYVCPFCEVMVNYRRRTLGTSTNQLYANTLVLFLQLTSQRHAVTTAPY